MSLPRRALVLGLARQGTAAAAALQRHAVDVVGADRKLGNDDDVSLLENVQVLVKSGGVPNDAPLVTAARVRGIPIWSDIEVGYRLVRNPLLCVTGTNGKTTTVGLLGAIFRAAGREVAVAGNEQRLQLPDLDGDVAADAWAVCEVSSFQLEHIDEFRPRIGVLLNLVPDHLDRHDTFEAYTHAKLRVFENQRDDDFAIVPRGFGAVPGAGRRVEFGADDPLPAEPRIPGMHNRENAAGATAAARAAGIRDDAIAQAMRDFPGVPHRLELVRERHGVRFVNDSKATNVGAALRAIAAYEAPLLLILGGRAKGESFAPLAHASRGKVRRAYVIGEASSDLSGTLADVPHETSGDLETAVRAAAAQAQPGDVVLLAPACASYDQFRDFEQRGDEFRRLVEAL